MIPLANVVVLAAATAVVLALFVPLAAWLIYVGGWTRVGVGATLAVLGLGYATQLERKS